MFKLKLLTIIATSGVLLAGCGTAAAQATTVNATLGNMKISVDRSSVPAGAITFVVKNTDRVEHELVVLKTDLAPDKIAADTDEVGKVDETGNMGETGDMDPGTSRSFTLTLPAGHYVLICNEIGHYDAGMRMSFTVN